MPGEKMIRKNLFIYKYQDDALEKLPGNLSENVRSAIDDYLTKMNASNGATSPSKNIKETINNE